MRVIFNGFRRAALLAAAMFSFSTIILAQDAATDEAATAVAPGSNYDPIGSMLDSLVNLSYVQRLNFAASGSQHSAYAGQPYEIPTYSDDVYAKRMTKIQSPIPLVFNQQVKEYIDMYAVRKPGLTE